ncbi:MAG: hypothetical protein COB75_04180 [Idiomarina sp.]|nr:hypothetical protein [Idiomarina sp.]PHQ77280.1 MAG: hypothetical protein COB75_04180 [Idiomarina sp.]
MKNLTSVVLIVLAALFLLPNKSAAQEWDASGEGKVTYPSGRTEPLTFGFSYKKTFGTSVFSAGKAKMRTDEIPPNYILNVIVNDEGLLYIAEFADGFFQSFELALGGHKVAIKPRREFDEDEPIKHLAVYIDDMSYLLDTTHPSLKFSFDENGISDINGNGLIRDLSSRR